jgi:Mn-containing catalase
MFHHLKELQFNARVSKPDPRFASLLLEQFGRANGELKADSMFIYVPAKGGRFGRETGKGAQLRAQGDGS